METFIMTSNFKPPAPIRDKKHLAFVASLPCCIEGRTGNVVPHHLLRGTGEKCGGRKSGDNWTIPLGAETHMDLHAWGDETWYLGKSDIDGPALAKALYEATGDYEQALNVLKGDGG